MLQQDAANLRVLYIGGTGTISASCVRLSVETGMRVSVLNRGRNTSDRTIPDTVETLIGDVNDDAAIAVAIGDRGVVVHVSDQRLDGVGDRPVTRVPPAVEHGHAHARLDRKAYARCADRSGPADVEYPQVRGVLLQHAVSSVLRLARRTSRRSRSRSNR